VKNQTNKNHTKTPRAWRK